MDLSKDSSRSALLDAIRRAKRIARIDLAQLTDISPATVTTVTADMIRQGLIEEVIPEELTSQSRRGRPRVNLKLRADAFLVAGLKVAETTISVVLVNFVGEVVAQHTYHRTETRPAPEILITQIQQAIDATLADVDYVFEDLSAVGLGIAGIVDAKRGFVHWSPFLNTRNLELARMLKEAVNLPIFLDNDANLVAMAEQYLGNAQNTGNFIVVTIESGVGMGIVIDNKVYRGTRGCGAEFGHTKVQLDGALCRCGQRGCLEAYVADYALLREASFDTSLFKEGGAERSIQDLLTAARKGDPTAKSIIDRSSRIFAMGLSNLINLFDPELIILSGERMSFDHLYAEEVIEVIRSSIVQVDAPPPDIIVHKWGDFMWERGAAAFALVGVAEMSLRDGLDRVA
ncbi:ROK family protein [uncultured Sulfitobacter sp.]|uniref:ROK family transcriptional regulator n=1 Tax=uncultured Sulfitobacter sp. TaxID=191468 RepID=UPI002612FCFD|nr:ROK family protein [uncultured Sulfitobacter sp.]